MHVENDYSAHKRVYHVVIVKKRLRHMSMLLYRSISILIPVPTTSPMEIYHEISHPDADLPVQVLVVLVLSTTTDLGLIPAQEEIVT